MPVLAVVTLRASVGSAVPPSAAGPRPVLAVSGEVTSPLAYTAAQLAALPQTTVTVTTGRRTVTDSGVLLETLVAMAGPAYPATLLNIKNELLRVTATVRGARHAAVTFAVG